ncbi:MAG: ATPase, T2SS/T4P/T4SS family [Anaerolineae bacterium]
MTDNPTPPQNGTSGDEPALPLSNLLPTSTGHIVSTKGLLERIVEQVRAEFDDARLMAASPTEQRTLIRDVAQYVISVENVVLTTTEQARLIQQAASELLGYGVLDPLLQDESITTVLIDGLDGVAVRRGPGSELEALPTVFDDHGHLRRVVDRLLLNANVRPTQQLPIVETGLTLYGRRASLNVALPPFVPQVRVDIRLHGREARSFDDWVRLGIISPRAVTLLQHLAESSYGLMVVGDTESGKTTLLNMLGRSLTTSWGVVERAPELHVEPSVPRLTVHYADNAVEARTLAQRVHEALAMNLETLLLDEVRADEPEAIAPLLLEPAPRQIWSFRGTAEPKRMKAALTILVQRATGARYEEALSALFERLPFVVMLKRRRSGLRLVEIAEWQQQGDSVVLVSLLRGEGDDHVPTGLAPMRELPLPAMFWKP